MRRVSLYHDGSLQPIVLLDEPLGVGLRRAGWRGEVVAVSVWLVWLACLAVVAGWRSLRIDTGQRG